MAKYDFNQSEVEALGVMIDLAVKSGGIRVAEAGVLIMKKLGNPIPEPEPVKEEPPKDAK